MCIHIISLWSGKSLTVYSTDSKILQSLSMLMSFHLEHAYKSLLVVQNIRPQNYCEVYNKTLFSSLGSLLQNGWSSPHMKWDCKSMEFLFALRILAVSSSWDDWWRRSLNPGSASWKVSYDKQQIILLLVLLRGVLVWGCFFSLVLVCFLGFVVCFFLMWAI